MLPLFYLFYFWLLAQAFSLVAAGEVTLVTGFSPQRLLLLQSMGSVVAAPGL